MATDQRIKRHPSIVIGVGLGEIRVVVIALLGVGERVGINRSVSGESSFVVIKRDILDLAVVVVILGVCDDGRADGRHVRHFVQGDAGEGVHLLAGVGVGVSFAVGDDGIELRTVPSDWAEVDFLEAICFDVADSVVEAGVGFGSFGAAYFLVGCFWVFVVVVCRQWLARLSQVKLFFDVQTMMALRGQFRDKGLDLESQQSVSLYSHIFPRLSSSERS